MSEGGLLTSGVVPLPATAHRNRSISVRKIFVSAATASRRKYAFTVKATDKAGLFEAKPVTVTITGLPDPPAKLSN